MYTVKEVAKELGITPRAVVMRCKDARLKKLGRSYHIPERLFNLWRYGRENPTETEVKEVALPNEKEVSEVSEEAEVRIEEDGYYLEHRKYNTVTITLTQGKHDEMLKIVSEFYHMEEKTQEAKQIVKQLQANLDEKTRLLHKALDTIKDSVQTLHQQQFIEAKDKGYDK